MTDPAGAAERLRAYLNATTAIHDPDHVYDRIGDDQQPLLAGGWPLRLADIKAVLNDRDRLQVERDALRAAVSRALELLDGWDWDQSRSGGDNSAIPAAIAVLRGEPDGGAP